MSGNIGDKAAVAKMKEDIEAKLDLVEILVNCAGGDIGAAGGKPDPHDALGIPLEDIRGDREQPLWHDPRLSDLRTADDEGGQRIGDRHRLSRGAIRVTNGVIYAALKARRHPLHSLPRSVRSDGGRSGQCGSPGTTDRAVQGDAGRRSEKDGFVEQVVYPLWGARRNGRRGRLPGGPEKQIYQRPGSSGGWRGNAVSEVTNG